MVESYAEVQRQPAHPPLILCEQSQVQFHVVGGLQGSGHLQQLHRDPVAQLVLNRKVGVQQPGVGRIQPGHRLHPDLQRVRPGNVARAEHRVVLLGDAVDARQRDWGPIIEAGRELEHANITRRNLRLRISVNLAVSHGEARLEEQLVRAGMAPVRLGHHARPHAVVRRVFGSLRRAETVPAGAPPLERDDPGHLVLRGGLPRQPGREIAGPGIDRRRAGEVGVVAEGVFQLRLVEKNPRLTFLRLPRPEGRIEPGAVLADRPANRAAGRVDEVDLVPPSGEAAGAQSVRDVVVLQPLACVLALGRPVKAVAPLPEDHVDRHTARLGFRALPAGLGDDLLGAILVEIEPARGAHGRHRVGAHALDAISAIDPAPVNRHRVHTFVVVAAHIAVATAPEKPAAAAHSERERRHSHVALRGGDDAQQLLGHRLLATYVLHVDDRTSAGHGHRFLERPDLQVRVHCRGEAC